MKRCFIYCTFLLLNLSFYLQAQEFVVVENPESPIDTVNIRGFYRGCAWVDVDNDGDLDLSIEGFAFRNEGNGVFSTIESFGSQEGVDYLGGVSWADYGNDGDLDCLYSSATGINGTTVATTVILENDGTGVFTEKKIDADPDRSLKTWSACWGEYNNDGQIDVTGAVAFGFLQGLLDTPGFFYTGNADGTFTEITDAEFTQETAPYTVAYWTDYDEDGDADLFIASGPGGSAGPDFHYKNLLSESGTASLERITDAPFAMDAQDGQNYNFIDYDLDGDLDLYLTNYGGAPNRFYRNDNGTYSSIQNALTFPGTSLGNCWGDFDNDGDQDVLITADNINQTGYFRNDGGIFMEMENPFSGVFPGNSNVSGLTIGDYDNDGDLDFFANGGITSQNGPRALYRNELDNGNHWVNFTCEGNPSNRAAIGTRIRLQAVINGQTTWLQREITAQNTFMGHNSLRVHFGLGAAEVIDSLIFEWPSGNIDAYANLAVDTFYQVVEGQTLVDVTETLHLIEENLTIIPNPSNGGSVQMQNVFSTNEVRMIISDVSGKQLISSLIDVSDEWISVDTVGLQKGIYLLQLSNGVEVATAKLIVQ